ncbi:B-cell receptor CD22-like [Salvelinus alpinus]|uniref:B-cell receptor CD22-like n=1 Tax=Salvelinus alpinus TaxID=8036 RepID=UPI0039FCC0F7
MARSLQRRSPVRSLRRRSPVRSLRRRSPVRSLRRRSPVRSLRRRSPVRFHRSGGYVPNRSRHRDSETVNRYQGKITGNMSQKNCTTVFFNFIFHSSKIRVEQVDSLTISVKYIYLQCITDLPSSPIITVSGEVKEGTPVSLNCSAVAPCPEHPPELTWTLPKQFTTENQLQENPDQTKSVLSTVTFTPSYLHHEKNITCTAVYPVGASNKTAEHNMMLNVSFSPKDTSASISPADPVLMDSCVNLTCSSTANPPVTNFTWFQISGGKPTQVASGQSYSLNVTIRDGGLYYCEARNSHGCGKSKEVQLAIKGQEEPVNPKVYEIVGKTLGLLFLFSLVVFFAWRRRTSRLPSGFDMTDLSQGQNSPAGTVCSNQARVGRGNQEPPLNNLDGLHAQDNKRGAFYVFCQWVLSLFMYSIVIVYSFSIYTFVTFVIVCSLII